MPYLVVLQLLLLLFAPSVSHYIVFNGFQRVSHDGSPTRVANQLPTLKRCGRERHIFCSFSGSESSSHLLPVLICSWRTILSAIWQRWLAVTCQSRWDGNDRNITNGANNAKTMWSNGVGEHPLIRMVNHQPNSANYTFWIPIIRLLGVPDGVWSTRRQILPKKANFSNQSPSVATNNHHWPTPRNYGMNSIVGWLFQAFSYRLNWILSCIGKTAIKQQSRTNTYLAVDWWWLYPAIQCMSVHVQATDQHTQVIYHIKLYWLVLISSSRWSTGQKSKHDNGLLKTTVLAWQCLTVWKLTIVNINQLTISSVTAVFALAFLLPATAPKELGHKKEGAKDKKPQGLQNESWQSTVGTQTNLEAEHHHF